MPSSDKTRFFVNASFRFRFCFPAPACLVVVLLAIFALINVNVHNSPPHLNPNLLPDIIPFGELTSLCSSPISYQFSVYRFLAIN